MLIFSQLNFQHIVFEFSPSSLFTFCMSKHILSGSQPTKNAYFLAKIGADTAENEQHFAEILPIGRRVADRTGVGRTRAANAVEKPDYFPAAPAVGGLDRRKHTSRSACEFT